MITEKMVEAALTALGGKVIDGRQFWTDEDKALMRSAISAAFEVAYTHRRLEKLESMGFGAAAEFARNPIPD